MFRKVLIANRGEIACRVAATARGMGIRTVAVYSDADADARHVAECDEAYRLGPAPARESYLLGDRIIAIARECGAEAIHPGYGFLSENEDFAEACVAAGLVFIGPPASAIRAMGLKAESKRLMAEAGVPLTPGYHGADQDPALLEAEAGRIGYPVLIKASAGGGGKGMRIVERAADFAAALASCKREAGASFGEDAVLIEKYLTRPRHIEIQVFADSHGNCVHLFERDCSVQRRHQKVLEEAPAPGMTDERRAAMGQAAVEAALAVGYVGAGTVEFIVPGDRSGEGGEDGAFFFMEMNTRLQVEHPVTEEITGLDLVEWQLRVASGEELPLTQEEIAISGHAIEARIYAENPAKNFLPSIGTITHMRMPVADDHGAVRIDSGVREGDAISPYYDPMIAKLIVWAENRDAALRGMAAALRECEIAGLSTNVEFLHRVVESRAFATGDLDTGLIERHRAELLPQGLVLPPQALAAAAWMLLSFDHKPAAPTPWDIRDGWRMNLSSRRGFHFKAGETVHRVELIHGAPALRLAVDGVEAAVTGSVKARRVTLAWGGARIEAGVVIDGARCTVFMQGRRFDLEQLDPLALVAVDDDDAAGGHLRAPMSGKVLSLVATPGAKVAKGAPLMVMEAMKMEHAIIAPAAGAVRVFHFAAGDQVAEGAELLDFDVAA